MDTTSKFLIRKFGPVQQVLLLSSLMLIAMLIAFTVSAFKVNLGETIYWELGLSFMLFFSLVNVIFFLNAVDKNKYWTQSLISYMALLGLSIGLAFLFSKNGLSSSGSIRWIYFVFGFGYLVFISIIGLVRKIVEIAIRQDKQLRGEQ